MLLLILLSLKILTIPISQKTRKMAPFILKVSILILVSTSILANVSKQEEERLKKLLKISKLPESYEVVYPKSGGKNGKKPLPRIYAKRTGTHFRNHTEYFQNNKELIASFHEEAEETREIYMKKCSTEHPQKLEVTQKDLDMGDAKLRNFMGFMRK